MQSDYCVLEREGPDTYPLLGWDQSGRAFRKGTAVHVTEPIRLRLRTPVPGTPVMVDHHSLPAPVLSTRLKEVLAPLSLYNVQLVPADVRVGDAVLRYWLLHVHNEVPCMDKARSVFELSSCGRLVLSLDKLVLDENVLADIPLERRLVFVLAEATSVCLVHCSVIDRMLSLTPRPQGLRFIPVTEWSDAAGFRGDTSS
ncbi:imm11 family protein [Pyxidicoccus caerfyrddinensis]|uniref:imm11 family protein n=1 Tax=Pyxidicoccus caerfyrddinensis TaxID=2709663 RepID=UPI0013DB4470|nr:DUF1629 domain-containing protein [Pyxidicoccus caerfyrddinensis]